MEKSFDAENRIPKVIHYCWFGRNPKSELIQKCIQSWKEKCPDYQIVEWNEDNWDIDAYPYAREAYDAKKWAFVSDVARLDILYRHGGIYLDTDVELLRDDPFLDMLIRVAFFPFENERRINTGQCFGAEKECWFVDKLMDSYRVRHFDAENISAEKNTLINRPVFCEVLKVAWNDKHQIIQNIEIITTGMFGSFGKHYGTRTWDPEQAKYTLRNRKYKDTRLKRFLRQPKIFTWIEEHFGEGKVLKVYTVLVYDLLECGLLYYFKRLLRKIRKAG